MRVRRAGMSTAPGRGYAPERVADRGQKFRMGSPGHQLKKPTHLDHRFRRRALEVCGCPSEAEIF